MSFEEIGQKIGLETNVIRRFLRSAMAMHILDEPEPGMVGHTSISKFLANPAIFFVTLMDYCPIPPECP